MLVLQSYWTYFVIIPYPRKR